jgi:hypothetical protein
MRAQFDKGHEHAAGRSDTRGKLKHCRHLTPHVTSDIRLDASNVKQEISKASAVPVKF